MLSQNLNAAQNRRAHSKNDHYQDLGNQVLESDDQNQVQVNSGPQ